MIRHPQPNRSPTGILQPLGHFASRLENECVGAGRVRLDEPIRPVVDPGVKADFRKITAYQGEIVMFVGLADPANPVHCPLVAYVTAERITRVRRIRNQPAAADSRDDFGDPPGLRICGVNFNQSRHLRIVTTPATKRRNSFRHFERDVIYVIIRHPFQRSVLEPLMQLFVDYIPIVVFILAYFYKDIFFATGVLMAVMPVVLVLQWLMTKKINKIYAASTALVLVLGGATLVFRNPTFLYWKPTVLNWLIAIVFLGSQWIGEKTIVQRMLGNAAELSRDQWARLNQIWVVFFIVIGGVNLYVAFNFSEAFWVKFKLFGMLGLTLVFVIIQSIWLTLATQKNATAAEDSET